MCPGLGGRAVNFAYRSDTCLFVEDLGQLLRERTQPSGLASEEAGTADDLDTVTKGKKMEENQALDKSTIQLETHGCL